MIKPHPWMGYHQAVLAVSNYVIVKRVKRWADPVAKSVRIRVRARVWRPERPPFSAVFDGRWSPALDDTAHP